MKSPESVRNLLFRVGVGALVGLYLLLIMPGLGALSFWIDEGFTACLGLSVLENGVPSVIYGQRLMDAEPHAANFMDLESAHGWGSYYLCAAGFFLFGKSEWAGRFPFVLCSALAVALLAILGRHFYGRAIGLLAGLFLTLQPTFLQYSRQCRYYPLAMLFFLVVIWVYLMVRQKRIHWMYLCLSCLLLFHASQLFSAILLAGLVAQELASRGWAHIRGKNPPDNVPWFRVLGGCTVLIVPWMIFFSIGREGTLMQPGFDPLVVWKHFSLCLKETLAFFPFVLFLGLIPSRGGKPSYFIPALTLLSCAVISFVPQSVFDRTTPFHDRYFLFMLPLGALASARGVLLLRRWWTWVILGAIVLTICLPLGPLNKTRIWTENARTVWAQLRDSTLYYRNPLSPEPGRLTMETVEKMAGSYPVILVDTINYQQFVFSLGPEKVDRIENWKNNRPADGFLLVQDPAYKKDTPDYVNECKLTLCEKCSLIWLNQPEMHERYSWQAGQIPLKIWDCPPQ